ncbi:MAG TPA: YedE family putative selenium transporter [Planctomycetota bacterium]|nr:YedE family putative selenium transporter [Planctomycetota bacterium]HRR80001.1 YedE family putative selenium transporter [Planctomycetota bacterium]HRT96157.1 YedE family putative selenium transporter [Planctomycetota bacterium]
MASEGGARQAISRFLASRAGIIGVGLFIGVVASLLQRAGNPPNMGICVACFERDTAGGLGLHRAAAVQYVRPEIIGFVLGALASALAFREFKPRGGSAPIVRFLLGVFAAIGALAFLGCPWRALLRLAGGDGNALLGLAGLVAGVSLGAAFLKRGYTLGRSSPATPLSGLILPAIMLLLLGLVAFKVSFGPGGALFFSEKGPGAMHASLAVSLCAGLGIGVLAQRSRFCTMGAIRDAVLIRDFHLLSGAAALVAAAFATNLALGQFKTGFAAMPIAHSNHAWNFLGMALSGLAFALAGGCPGRQLFLSGEGDGDAAVFVCGMIVGAAFAHNFFLAGAPDVFADGALKVGGPGHYGKVAVVAGLAFCTLLGLTARRKG